MTTYFENVDFSKVNEALSKAVEAFGEFVKSFIEIIKKAFNIFWESLREFLKKTNPHLFHLAYKHQKSRTRKKNIKRLWRIFQRKGNKNG